MVRDNAVNARPVVIDVRVWKDGKVWPMLAAGSSNDSGTYFPGISPLLAGDAAPGTEGRSGLAAQGETSPDATASTEIAPHHEATSLPHHAPHPHNAPLPPTTSKD